MSRENRDMNRATVAQFVGLEGASLDVGQTAGPMVCPTCGGGRSGEAKFYVTRTENGVLAWVCHRASCDERGVIGEHAVPRGEPKKAKTRQYTGEIHELTEEDINYFDVEYGLADPEGWIKLTGKGEYLLPIFPPQQGVGVRGYVIRQPWSTCLHRQALPQYPKAVTFLHEDAPLLSWYGEHLLHGRPIVLVEDQLSAMRAAVVLGGRARAAALLGTHMDLRKVAEIQRQNPSEVILALDADATEHAFKLARQWGTAFHRMRVAILEQDIKDTPARQIREVLGLA